VQVPVPITLASTEDLYSTIGGGSKNISSASHTTVSGGQSNTASASHATVGGGHQNNAVYFFATVSGGYANTAQGRDSFVGGGSRNTAVGDRSTIGGGIQNIAEASDSTVSGGAFNLATDNYAVVGGGTRNQASGYVSTICGGAGNLANSDQSSILGGLHNQAVDIYSTVGGGYGNIASGEYSSVPGGLMNEAGGDFSVAAGQQANISSGHPGVFMYSDSNPFPFQSQRQDEFAVRATGGVRFISGIDSEGNPSSGVVLQQGSGAWSTLSDQSSKTDFLSVDPREIIQDLNQIPITSWRYQGQESTIRHIGPMAADFYDTFGFGEDKRFISSVDADGIALTAVQGLYQLLQDQEQRLVDLEDQARQLEDSLIITRSILVKSIGFLAVVSCGLIFMIWKYSQVVSGQSFR